MAQIIQPWRFTSPEAKLTVHIRDRAPDGELLGLLMHDARDPKQIVTYLAERARIIKQGGRAYLRMDKGHIVRRLENEAAPQIIAFDRYVVDANQLEQRADQTDVHAAAPALHARAAAPRSRTTPSTRRNPGSYRRRAARALRQPALCLRLRARRAGVHGPGPDHAHEPHAGRHRRLRASPCSPHPRHHLRQHGGRCARRRRRCSMRCPPAAAVLAAVAIQWHMYPRRPLARWRARRAACSSGSAWASPPCGRGDALLRASGHAGPSRHVRTPHAAPLRRQALPAVDPGRIRRLRGADLHDRHDRAAAAVAARQRPVHGVAAVDGAAAPAGLHGDPAGVRRAGRRHRRAAEPQPQVGAHRHARGRHVGVAVPAPGPGGGAGARGRRRRPLQSAGSRRPLGGRAADRGGLRQGGEPACQLGRGLVAAPGRRRRTIGDERARRSPIRACRWSA